MESIPEFAPTKFSTAEDKKKFVIKLQALIASDFAHTKFTRDLYKRLSLTFSFLAENNKDGFYNRWMVSTRDKVDFLKKITQHIAYGDPAHTWSDVEKYLSSSEFIQAQYNAYVERAAYERKWQDIRLRNDLVLEYGIEGVKVSPDVFDTLSMQLQTFITDFGEDYGLIVPDDADNTYPTLARELLKAIGITRVRK